MSQLYIENNASSTITDDPLNSGATSVTVESGDGSMFPSSTPFRATIWDSSSYDKPSEDPDMEIVEVTGISTDTFNITRAMEGTSDVQHPNGSTFANYVTRGYFEDSSHGIQTRLTSVENDYVNTTEQSTINFGGSPGTGAEYNVWFDTDNYKINVYYAGMWFKFGVSSHNDLNDVDGNGNHLTTDQNDAVDGANSPSSSNVFATMNDVGEKPQYTFHLSGGAVTLGDGQSYILKKWVAPSAQDITANHGGISSLADGTHVTGLEIRVNNITQSTTSTLINSNYYSDSTGTTVSIASGDEVNVELYNSTGSTQDIVADVGGVIV